MRLLLLVLFFLPGLTLQAQPLVSEAEFFAQTFDGDLTEFLKKKGIAYTCVRSLDEAFKSRFTGIMASCHTKKVWMQRNRSEKPGHHMVTKIARIREMKDGIADGLELLPGTGIRRNYNIYSKGKAILMLFRNDTGVIERSEFPDCLPMVEPRLFPVPQAVRFTGHPNQSCVAEVKRFTTSRSLCTSPRDGDVMRYSSQGLLVARYSLKNGLVHGLVINGSEVARMENGVEVAYAAFNARTCQILPESNPALRDTDYKPGKFRPSFFHVPIFRPDEAEAYKKQRNTAIGVSALMTPFIYLGSPLLIWVAPGLFPGSVPTASATYSFGDKYWEGALGILSFRSRDWSVSGQAFHYTFKKVKDTRLWGMRYSIGGGAFIFFANLQAGLAFEKTKLSQGILDVCGLPLLSVCFGTRIPLTDSAEDLEAPLQVSLKLGI
jgi:hypothetical protein